MLLMSDQLWSKQDSTKCKLAIELSGCTSTSKESQTFQLSSNNRLESRNYLMLGVLNNRPISKSVNLSYGIGLGYYATHYKYDFQSSYNATIYNGEDSFYFKSIMIRPVLGLNYFPFARKPKKSSFAVTGCIGYQLNVPIEASGYEYQYYYQAVDNTLKEKTKNYEYNKLPLSPFFVKIGFGNDLKFIKLPKSKKLGYQLSWTRNFGSDNSGLNSSSTGQFGYVSSDKRSGLGGLELSLRYY